MKWYQANIAHTYHDFGHHMLQIPPYELVRVPKPADLNMNGLDPNEYLRFVIAYGLSIPLGEGPDTNLPSKIADAERPQVVRPREDIDYSNSKDIFE